MKISFDFGFLSSALRMAAVLAAGLCLALLGGPRRGAAASACLDRFLVRPGDTLYGIAVHYGFDLQVIAELNDLERPYDLYAGQWLCLPAKVGAEAAAATPHPSRLPRFTVRISGKWVEIETQNFPARNVYAVRAYYKDPGVQRPASSWLKLGSLRTRKGGELQVRYPLPQELRKAARIEVCLKNATTNELACQAVNNPQ